MKLHCPDCGVKGSADDSYHGKNVKCPKCQKIFVALEAAAVEREQDKAEDSALSIQANEQVPVAGPTDLREEEDILEQLGMLAEEESPAVETPAEELVNGDREPVVADAAVEDTLVEKEEVLDWSDIVEEIDSRSADDELHEKKDWEGAPAGFASLFEYTEKPGEELNLSVEGKHEPAEPEAEIAVTPDVTPTAKVDREEPESQPVKSDESQESYFIFEDHGGEGQTVQEVERQPYGLEKEQCWQCGKKDSVGVPFIAKDGRLYCPDCVPVDELEVGREDQASTERGGGGPLPAEEAPPASDLPEGLKYRFTIGGVIREAWEKTKGAKGAIWAGSAVMYLVILVLVAGTAFLLPMNGNGANMFGLVGNALFQAITDAVTVLFTAGLLFMGIRKVAGAPISWKMVFTGFPVAGKIIVAAILQSILIFIGILLLVLPGIYLAIGYAMTMPLIIDRGMSPWQAMEASRKAIHKVWWKVAGLFFVMGMIFLISMLPLGIGTIWTWPMFFILTGVVYRHLFGVEKKIG